LFKKFSIVLIIIVTTIVLALLLLRPMLKLFIPEYENRDKCESLGTLELICGLQNPEDFAKIPHENAVIV
tara:strand:+ start:451 stop:660 length:210 start_codon:yes stop_codon:yes gene_type:complete